MYRDRIWRYKSQKVRKRQVGDWSVATIGDESLDIFIRVDPGEREGVFYVLTKL